MSSACVVVDSRGLEILSACLGSGKMKAPASRVLGVMYYSYSLGFRV